MERAREYQKKLYLCFIDYTKAFDCIKHANIWVALREIAVLVHLIKLIRSLNDNQEATVRTRYGDTEWFKIKKGTRQGCILSPLLFKLYMEVIMRKLDLDNWSIGVKVNGRTISNRRYADDMTLLAERPKEADPEAERRKHGNCRTRTWTYVTYHPHISFSPRETPNLATDGL
ncbi:hypothetical protein P4O66_003856 [Electrophorus voltai]|uniref:Reverse transcriptase domain-containing protein n=1 Tax=Electrophorus voltai TaxID=2609070 RepID=A0AAD8ZRE1_9TELE|nr:hypothetical protein P4O66_003856 [Electrophorus voltai]